jgi:hypothetical protein
MWCLVIFWFVLLVLYQSLIYKIINKDVAQNPKTRNNCTNIYVV